jgi:hypothetical protein
MHSLSTKDARKEFRKCRDVGFGGEIVIELTRPFFQALGVKLGDGELLAIIFDHLEGGMIMSNVSERFSSKELSFIAGFEVYGTLPEEKNIHKSFCAPSRGYDGLTGRSKRLELILTSAA